MEKPKIDKSESRKKVLNFDDFQGPNSIKLRPTKKPDEPAPSEISTGTVQKKKSSLSSLKPSNSLKSSEGSHFNFFSSLFNFKIKIKTKISSPQTESPSNLVKLRNSHLGKSAPSLNARSLKDCPVVMRRLQHQTSQQIRSPAVHRISFTSCLSPRSESPVSRSPLDSPRINSPSANHFQFMPFKRLSANKVQDNCRRWSIVSLPSSSGYASTTTPCSSNISVSQIDANAN